MIINKANKISPNGRKKNFILLFFLFASILTIYLFFNIKTNSYPWVGNIQITRHCIDYAVEFISFIFFLSILIFFNKYLRIVSYLLIILIFFNTLVSSCCYFFQIIFNGEVAYSIISTNTNEATSFFSIAFVPIIITIIFTILLIFLIELLARNINPPKKYLLIFSTVWIWLPMFWYIKEKRDLDIFEKKNPDRSGFKNLKNKNIFYNIGDFEHAYTLKKKLSKTLSFEPNLNNIKKTGKNGIETIVIVVGESERKQNMSLYKYYRNTTPFEKKESKNMLIYRNAVCPASVTAQAVPLTLSNITFYNFQNEKYNEITNNIVSVATKFNYSTYWITHSKSLEEILITTKVNKLFVKASSDDGDLLPYFYSLNKIKGKKLIVLHLIGSHLNAKYNYPKSQIFFSRQNKLDEYDNSVRYTDYILGKIFSALKNENASVIYYSDHGQEYKNDKFYHSQTKEASQIPYFIWYSDRVEKDLRITGEENKQTSTRTVYDKTLDLMGLYSINSEKKLPIKYILLSGQIINFDKLTE